MRRIVAVLLGAFGMLASCTQDFDQFTIGENAGSAGIDASAGAQGGGGTGGSGGSAGLPDAAPDGVAGAAGDAAPDGGCAQGSKSCGGSCVPETDPSFGCAAPSCTPCSFAQATAGCDASGSCVIDKCDAGYADCNGDAFDGCEIVLASDPLNCGGCGTVCVVPNATPGCVDQACVISSCDTGYSDCDAVPSTGCEINTSANPKYCGSCTNDCTLQPGTWTCDNGSCKVSQCPAGKGDCDNDPSTCETDTTTSLQHCGFCNNPCTLANATADCKTSQCTIKACDSGFADCDGIATNGCEVNLATDTSHCGKCGRACSTMNVGTAICSGGLCVSTCNPGYGNCTKPVQPATDDGCEANLLTSPANCGKCGEACSSNNVATLACTGGKCTPACNPGFGDCNAGLNPAPNDGCETPTSSDPLNCGGCGLQCGTQNVTQTVCAAGKCQPTCAVGFGDCNAASPPAPDDGCETGLGSNVDHCGQCGRACSSTNVSQKLCSAGVCTSTCVIGFGNCTTPNAPTADNGCETNVFSDTSNCGACNRTCVMTNVQTAACSSGICTSTCKPGFGNCIIPIAPQPDDGCETNTNTSVTDCGACNRDCSTAGTQALACTGGLCTSSCAGTLGNCSQPPAPNPDDGCETDTATNVANCGKCGRACNTTHVISLSCSAGVCDSYCDFGFANCTQPAGATADNGCELDVTGDDARCGSCTNSCTAQNGMVCGDRTPSAICGCNGDGDCRTNGSGTCDSSGLCSCPKLSGDVVCRPGEVCVKTGITNHDCSCNGGAACTGTELCCQNPPGCKNVATDPLSCGACGRACPPGFACNAGTCVCTTALSCNAGSSGSCSSGKCLCGTTTTACAYGQRCLPGGVCG